MKSPRDIGRAVEESGLTRLTVQPETIGIWFDGRVVLTVPRADFDALVDWYIGADAIRAYVAQKEAK